MSPRRRRETAADDEARTWRLMQAAENDYVARYVELAPDDIAGQEFTDFENVLSGLCPLAGAPYPPAGHTYPRKDMDSAEPPGCTC